MEAIVDNLSEYELERGKPMPSKNHAMVQANLIFELKLHYKLQFRILSEASLDMEPKGAVPDVSIYPPMPMDPFNDEVEMTQPPLCAIEIISPSQGNEHFVKKAGRYFAAGTRSCWVVDPVFQLIHVFDRPDHYQTFQAGRDTTLLDAQLGIELTLTEVFR